MIPAPGQPRSSPPAPLLRTEWTDPVTGTRGYLVIDRLVDGVASGGLRMRAGLTVDEVADLARAMTVKEALAYDPRLRRPLIGGAKGGIDLDPLDPRAQEVLDRYVAALLPVCREQWAFGEDLGLRQEQVDLAAARAGLDSTLTAAYRLLSEPSSAAMDRVRAGFAAVDGGISVGDLAGGLGVAQAVVTCLTRSGRDPVASTAVVQGAGTIGGAAARFLTRSGVRVVAMADAAGTVADPAGLDVEALLAARDSHGLLDRSRLPAGAVARPGDAWLDIACDVLVPAAVSYCIDSAQAERIESTWVVEGANLPCTAAGEATLLRRGITVLPDVVANSAANSWWWWVFFGDVDEPAHRQPSYDLVRSRMAALVDEVLDAADGAGVTPREAVEDVLLARQTGAG